MKTQMPIKASVIGQHFEKEKKGSGEADLKLMSYW